MVRTDPRKAAAIGHVARIIVAGEADRSTLERAVAAYAENVRRDGCPVDKRVYARTFFSPSEKMWKEILEGGNGAASGRPEAGDRAGCRRIGSPLAAFDAPEAQPTV
jgi:hypothetical protein